MKTHKIDPKTIKKSNPKTEDNVGSKENVTNNTSTVKTDVEMDVITDLDMISKELRDKETRENAVASEDIKESYLFLEPANEAVDLDSINPSIAPGSVTEFVLAPSATFVSGEYFEWIIN